MSAIKLDRIESISVRFFGATLILYFTENSAKRLLKEIIYFEQKLCILKANSGKSFCS